MNLHITRVVAALAVVAGVGLGACSDDKDTTKPAATTPAGEGTTPAAGGAVVTIENLTFSVPSSVKAGEEITITNNDGFQHTFTDTEGSFNVPLAGGASETLTVAEAGTYTVVCQIHSSMKTTLVVN